MTAKEQRVRDLWKNLCAWDGLNFNTDEVHEFSEDNPFLPAYREAIIEFCLEMFEGSTATTWQD